MEKLEYNHEGTVSHKLRQGKESVSKQGWPQMSNTAELPSNLGLEKC